MSQVKENQNFGGAGELSPRPAQETSLCADTRRRALEDAASIAEKASGDAIRLRDEYRKSNDGNEKAYAKELDAMQDYAAKIADAIRRLPTEVKKKNRNAIALGRRGGLKGGPARAAKMSATERSESARNAVKARWAKRNAPARDSGIE